MLIDSHCHLDDKKYTQSISEIIQDCKNNNVDKLINISTSLNDCYKNKDISSKYNDVYYSVAIYPHNDLSTNINDLINKLENDFLINKDSKLVAIGECGIDIIQNNSDKYETRDINSQKILFEEQIKLAIKYDLPLIIHNRNGDEIVLELLQKYSSNNNLRGVIHCFDSTYEVAKKFIDLNFYISFSGMVTFKNKKELHNVATNIDIDKFLVETDAPYLTPVPFRGQVNHPKNVTLVAKKVAELKNLPIHQIEKYSYENTLKLFNL